jgi:hypothetical protein
MRLKILERLERKSTSYLVLTLCQLFRVPSTNRCHSGSSPRAIVNASNDILIEKEQTKTVHSLWNLRIHTMIAAMRARKANFVDRRIKVLSLFEKYLQGNKTKSMNTISRKLEPKKLLLTRGTRGTVLSSIYPSPKEHPKCTWIRGHREFFARDW